MELYYSTRTAVPDAVTMSMLPPFAHGLIVEVDSDDGICASRIGFLRHLLQRSVFRLAQNLFVTARTAPEEVAYACHEVPEDIGTDDGLTGPRCRSIG